MERKGGKGRWSGGGQRLVSAGKRELHNLVPALALCERDLAVAPDEALLALVLAVFVLGVSSFSVTDPRSAERLNDRPND